MNQSASRGSWWLHWCAALATLALAAALPAVALPAPSPEAAIEALVEADGRPYAGLCQHTRLPEHIGAVCSKPIAQRHGVQAHLLGRIFSEFDTWVFLAPRAGGWTVVRTAPLDFSDVFGAIHWPG
jgi:hypothetical protein